jgi:hypothetical protein
MVQMTLVSWHSLAESASLASTTRKAATVSGGVARRMVYQIRGTDVLSIHSMKSPVIDTQRGWGFQSVA